ncbi:hypothetical protein GGU45_003499 [Niabella hirudinis]
MTFADIQGLEPHRAPQRYTIYLKNLSPSLLIFGVAKLQTFSHSNKNIFEIFLTFLLFNSLKPKNLKT